MCKYSFQVIDSCHIDLKCEWFLKGIGKKEPFSGKYMNDVSYEINFESELVPIYLDQIISKNIN